MRTLILTLSTVIPCTPALAGDGPGSAASEDGLAILTKKAVTVPLEGEQVVNDAVVLVKGGRIEGVHRRASFEIPEGYEVLDVGDRWVTPGLIDLHCHVASTNFFVNDLNDVVYLTNPGLRASTSVVPGTRHLLNGLAAGVTSVLYIPGSGSNIGGQGVLLKTGFDEYGRMEIRNPGSLKLAQAGNPEGWTVGVSRSFMNYNTRNTFQRGLAYAVRFAKAAAAGGDAPVKDPMWEVFRSLLAKETQVSTHTQIYQVVLMTITMIREELGLDVYIDHGSFDGWRAGKLAAEKGVPAILGPRQIAPHIVIEYRPGMFIGNDTDGRIYGMAAQYQAQGHELVGFNTDAPVIPEEALPLQAAMAVRYGFDTSRAQHVRGLTIVPAIAAGIDDRVGSLEPGKDADLLITDGDPADPRTTVSIVFIEGEAVYDTRTEQRRW
ncbi:MAG: amidohydrolase family protein [bacterium]|nr:amidohydrolase family protein [bacterium]